jgi:hypothetical protein
VRRRGVLDNINFMPKYIVSLNIEVEALNTTDAKEKFWAKIYDDTVDNDDLEVTDLKIE